MQAQVSHSPAAGVYLAEVGGAWQQKYKKLGSAKAGVRKQLIRARACLNAMDLGD